MARKFKVGDKVKVVKIIDKFNGRSNIYAGKEGYVTGILENGYMLDIDNCAFGWYEEELELANERDNSGLLSAIIEAAKQAPLIVEQLEDGSIKISPIKEEEKDDFPIDTTVIYSNNTDYWSVGKYKGFGIVSGKIYGKTEGDKYLYIIPFNKFDPENIEESLKYNIVK